MTATVGDLRGGRVDPRRWWVLAVIGTAQLMVVLDNSIVNIALPSAQADLGFSDANRQWIITAYALAFGSLLLFGGRLSDLIGRRTAFMVGLVGFAAASALGGAANGFAMLVIARAVQGVFGALLAPSALALLTTTFSDGKERGKAFGVFGALAGAGGAIGLLLGGLLTESLSWRWCLYVNLIFAGAALVGAALLMARPPADAARARLDLPGTAVGSAALFCLVFGFANVATHDWGSPWAWGFLVGGAVGLAGFVLLQARVRHPLLPLRVVLDRNRGGSYLAVLVVAVGMFGIFLFLTFFLQQNLRFTPVVTGVAFLPMVAGIMLAATSSTTLLLPRLGPKPLVPAGMTAAAGGLWWLSFLESGSSYAGHVLPPMILTGLGLGMAIAPSINTATRGVRPTDAGVASAMVNTMQQVGGAVGTALLASIAGTAARGYLTDHAGGPRDPGLLAAAAVHSYTVAFAWAAGIFLAGAITVGLVLRPGPPPATSITTRVHDRRGRLLVALGIAAVAELVERDGHGDLAATTARLAPRLPGSEPERARAVAHGLLRPLAAELVRDLADHPHPPALPAGPSRASPPAPGHHDTLPVRAGGASTR